MGGKNGILCPGKFTSPFGIRPWVHIPANLKHSIKAKTPVVMLLVLLK